MCVFVRLFSHYRLRGLRAIPNASVLHKRMKIKMAETTAFERERLARVSRGVMWVFYDRARTA